MNNNIIPDVPNNNNETNYYFKNRTNMRNSQRKYYFKNIEEFKSKKRIYYINNKEHLLENMKLAYLNNKDGLLDKRKNNMIECVLCNKLVRKTSWSAHLTHKYHIKQELYIGSINELLKLKNEIDIIDEHTIIDNAISILCSLLTHKSISDEVVRLSIKDEEKED